MKLGLRGALAGASLATLVTVAAGTFVSACSGSDDTPPASGDGGDGKGEAADHDATSGDDAGEPADAATTDGGHAPADGGTTGAHETGQRLTVNGKVRTYDITIPLGCSAARKLPLVFVFHGDGGRGSDMYGSNFPIEAAAAAGGGEAIFVYPDGLDDNDNGSAWNIYDDPGVFPYTKVAPTGNEDVDYFDALVQTLGSTTCGDAGHVFLTGFSNGGYLTNQLARWRSSVVKAAAPQSGGPPSGTVPTDYPVAPYCVGVTKAVPTLIVHGQTDGTVDPTLGEQAASYWDMANGCVSAASDCNGQLVAPPKTPTTPAAPSPCVLSTGCSQPVTFCFIPSMGHSIWSSAPGAIWALFASASAG